MKHKRLLFVIVGVFVLALGVTLSSKWHTFFPSQQMKDLRLLEAHLELPKPKYRTEEDLGLNKDSKGALHYDRHIALSYEDASVLDTLRSKLLNESWHEDEHHTDSSGSDMYFSFTKGSGNAMHCIGGYTREKDSDGITLYISLEAAGEYSCNPAPGV